MDYRQAEEEGRKYLNQYLEDLNLPVDKDGRMICPLCGSGSDKDSAFGVSKDGRQFKCFSCGEHGSIYDLLINLEHYPNLPAAVREVAKRYRIPIDEDDSWKWKRDQERKEKEKRMKKEDMRDWDWIITSDGIPPWEKKKNQSMSAINEKRPVQPTQPQQPIKKEPTPQEEKADYSPFIEEAAKHIRETDYLLKRGISYETAERFKVGFASNWKHPNVENPKVPFTPRLIIPSGKGGYTARLTREAKEHDLPKMKAGPQGIFNEDVIKEKEGPIFVVEGPIDALSVEEIGFPCVALGTTGNRGFIDKAIEIHPDAIILALDNDDAGKKASQSLLQELKSNGVHAYEADIVGSYKDPNEALANDKEGFIRAVKKAYNRIQEEWIQQNSDTKALEEFLKNGLSESAKTRPIPTGFPKLDFLLEGGLREGLYGVGAISSLGKTTFVCQIANYAAQHGEYVMIFSLEMSKLELISKAISRHTVLIERSKPNGNMRNAKTALGITDGHRYDNYSRAELELIQEASEAYRAYSDNMMTFEGIGDIGVREIRELVAQHVRITKKPPIVVIDYLQILSPADPHFTDKQNTDKAVLELKRISRDYKAPVIAISSFNRENYNSSVSMAAFKESGAIEYSTDVLLGLQLEGAGVKDFDVDAAKSEDPRRIELKILKNRRGKTGKSVFFDYYPAFNLFEERE